jgi:hypothetical protein
VPQSSKLSLQRERLVSWKLPLGCKRTIVELFSFTSLPLRSLSCVAYYPLFASTSQEIMQTRDTGKHL